MNTVTVTVKDRTKLMRFGETLTTGSVYAVSIEGGAATCGADSALYLVFHGRQMATAELTNGAGTLSLANDATAELAEAHEIGAVFIFDAVLRSFDDGAEQNVAVGQVFIICAKEGAANPAAGTTVRWKGEKGDKGDSFTYGDMTTAQKQEIADMAAASIAAQRTAAIAAIEDSQRAAQTAAESTGTAQAAAITRTGESILSDIRSATAELREVLGDTAKALEGESVSTNTIAGIRDGLKKVVTALGGTASAILLAIGICSAANAASVKTAPIGSLNLDDNPSVVTNVDLSGLITPFDLHFTNDYVRTSGCDMQGSLIFYNGTVTVRGNGSVATSLSGNGLTKFKQGTYYSYTLPDSSGTLAFESSVNAVASTTNHFLRLEGGTMTGNLTMSGAAGINFGDEHKRILRTGNHIEVHDFETELGSSLIPDGSAFATLNNLANAGYQTAEGVSNTVTQAYIRQKLGVYLYVGQDGGIYVHTGD